ncbi:MAG TPA: HAD-IIIA family hydrolase [Saprospiraceae bacterium]|nr:HAD-IIIA family hydrolase [Saprospiraceae bacterium]
MRKAINKNWTLFLDRDGVINRRKIDGYITMWSDFEFLPGSLKAIVYFSKIFDRLIIVTNQQGIGKGLFTTSDLAHIHSQMLNLIEKAGGRIDKVYYCPDLAKDKNNCRKPKPTMAYQAQKDFPEIVFQKSIIVGDSISDMQFGIQLNMKTVLIETKKEELLQSRRMNIDLRFKSLIDFANFLADD